ncbi:MAG: EAL domain-containing protein [Candidatus Nanopelagicales bacterium]
MRADGPPQPGEPPRALLLGQAVLAAVLALLLGLLAVSVFQRLAVEAEYAQVLDGHESQESNAVSTYTESVGLAAAVDSWLSGRSSRRDVQLARALLAQRLAVRDATGGDAADAAGPLYLSSLRALDEELALLPQGPVPADRAAAYEARLAPLLADFARETRSVISNYQRSASDAAAAASQQRRTTEERQLAVIVLVLLVGLALGLWVSWTVARAHRVGRRLLAEERVALDGHRRALRAASALEGGQSEVLELIATGAPLPDVCEAVARLAALATGRRTVVACADGMLRVDPPDSAGLPPAAECVSLWTWPFGPGTDGQPHGHLEILGADRLPLSEDEVRVLRRCVDLATIGVDRDRSSRELVERAELDPLTGLANRTPLLRDLDLAMAGDEREQVAVLFCDLDRFKVVNDSLGHKAGDRLLRQAAERLRGQTREGDVVARLGGDEFAVLCRSVGGRSGAEHLAQRVVAAFREPFALEGREVFVGASIGIAMADRPGGTAASLLRDADLAMYSVKGGTGHGWAVFDHAMEVAAARRLELDSALRRAVERQELTLEFQPVVWMSDQDRISGFESLVRWDRATDGISMPDSFLSTAEENGQIVDIGRWVLQEALRTFARWRDEGVAGDRVVSVNVAARQLHDPGFHDDVLSALVAYDVPPQALILELTEHTLIEGADAHQALDRLRSVGVRVALDDFGTGYSSLTQLRQLPVDFIKLDRSFVTPLAEQAGEQREVLRAVQHLAEALRIGVVIEGVETPEERQELVNVGFRLGQGFLFGTPVDAARAAELLRAETDLAERPVSASTAVRTGA